MAEGPYEGSYDRGRTSQPGDEDVNGFAVGLIIFAGSMMMIIAFFHVMQGLVAVINSNFYDVRPGYDVALDVQQWGWAQIVFGTILGFTGLFLFTGVLWARIVAIIMAGLSAIGSFYSIPYYPVWSILVIALDVAIIWALIAHGRELSWDRDR